MASQASPKKGGVKPPHSLRVLDRVSLVGRPGVQFGMDRGVRCKGRLKLCCLNVGAAHAGLKRVWRDGRALV